MIHSRIPSLRAVAKLADRAALGWAARSLENGLLSAASESSPRRAGHVSVCEVLPHESELDGRLGIRFLAQPSSSETNASIRWPRCLPAPGAEAENKTPVRCYLRASR